MLKLNTSKRTFIVFFSLFIFVFLSSDFSSDILHNGGISNITGIISSAFSPDLSPNILHRSLNASLITLIYGVGGITLALIFAFFLSITSVGILFGDTPLGKSLMLFTRYLQNFLRGIHELVWAWLFVASIGLSPLSAVLSIAIPYGGMIAKIWTDTLLSVPKGPLESLKSSGASSFQLLIFGYLPNAMPHMRNYGLYRLECAIRSSTILSFIGLRGLGYEIRLALNDLLYKEAWTYIYFLVMLVLLIGSFSSMYKRFGGTSINKQLSIVLYVFALFSWFYLLKIEGLSLDGIFSEKNSFFAGQFFKDLLGIGRKATPAFLHLSSWFYALSLTLRTLKMSILAIGLSALLVMVTLLPSSNFFILSKGHFSFTEKVLHRFSRLIIQIMYTFSRAIPEPVFGMMIIFILKPGIISGSLALALHNFGVLGKLSSDSLDNINRAPLDSLRSSGASTTQVLLFGVLPQMSKRFISFCVYRWEVILRSTIIIGFMGSGGLGQYFKLSMSLFHYTEVTLILLCYVSLVFMGDILGGILRKSL